MSVWDETHSFASTLQLLSLNTSVGGKQEGHVTRDETGCVIGRAQITCVKKGGYSKKKIKTSPFTAEKGKESERCRVDQGCGEKSSLALKDEGTTLVRSRSQKKGILLMGKNLC